MYRNIKEIYITIFFKELKNYLYLFFMKKKLIKY
jgi:hypothetical protein